MADSKACDEMYSWWVDLLVSYGLNAKNKDPLNTDSKIALSQDNGVICFKYSPRHYFFGVDSDNGNAFWYAFLPEIEKTMAAEKRQEFCSELEQALNQAKDKEFSSFFTLPVKVNCSERQFADKTYSGIFVRTNSQRDLFAKRELSHRALQSWRKNIFIPLCKFLETQQK